MSQIDRVAKIRLPVQEKAISILKSACEKYAGDQRAELPALAFCFLQIL